MRKIILLGILILSVILLAGCKPETAPKEVTKISITDCKAMTDEIERNFCYADVAETEKDILICNNIDNTNTKDICYQRVAIAKQDVLVCKLISEENQHSGVGSRCYSEIAKLKKDSSLCDDLPDYLSDECYLGAAIGKADASVCDKILYSVTKDDCYLDVASLSNDSALCNKITRTSDRERCLAITT